MDQPGLYCIFDLRAERYAPPFVEVNDAVADRRFTDLLQNKQLLFSMHPEDYRLYRVGSFNEETGECTWLGPDRKVCVNEGFTPAGRPVDVVSVEDQVRAKFNAWLAARGLGEGQVPRELKGVI